MPVQVQRLELGAPPTRTVTRGPLAGQQVPKFEVILPGWSDIIRVQSTSSLTPAEAAVERQRRQAQLSRSPTPDVVNNLSKIGQAVDDVQDALVTLSLLGRIATKIAGRAIPGLGTIATAADALNILNVFYPNELGKVAVGAVQRSGPKLSGRAKYLASKDIKRLLGLAPDQSLTTYLRRLDETVRTGKVNVGLGELLQVAQTSEALTGYGLALGPIFGGLQDTFFGLLRGARFDLSGPIGLTAPSATAEQLAHMAQFAPGQYEMLRARAQQLAGAQGYPLPRDPAAVARVLANNPVRVQVDFPGFFPLTDQLLGVGPGVTEATLADLMGPAAQVINKGAVVSLGAIGAVKRSAVRAAVKVFDGAKWLVGVRGDLTWSDHVEITCAQILAMQELSQFTVDVDWSIPVAFGGSSDVEPLPFCPVAHDHARDPGSVANCLARGPGKFGFDWVDQAPTSEARAFSVALIDAAAELVPRFLEGPHVKVHQDSGPYFRILRLLHEYDLLPPYQRDDVETTSFLSALRVYLDLHSGELPSFDYVRSLYLKSFPAAVLS